MREHLVPVAVFVALAVLGGACDDGTAAPAMSRTPGAVSASPAAEATRAAALARPRWEAPASYPMERHIGTATLLADGRVLLAGGSNNEVLAAAELFDPRTGTVSAGGRIVRVRQTHSATLLADGRVLIAAGQAPEPGMLARIGDIEVFDPVAGAFTAAGILPASVRGPASGVLLADGRALIAAGAHAALFDPRTGATTDAAAGLTARGFEGRTVAWPQLATALADGTVLLTGGCCDKTQWTNDLAGPTDTAAALYDPRDHSLTALPPLGTPRMWHTATLLADGRVLIAGGAVAYGHATIEATAAVEVFDPRTRQFTTAPPMAALRVWGSAVALPDGRVFVLGAFNYQGPSTAELFVP